VVASICPKHWIPIELDVEAQFIDYRGRTPKKTISGIPLITAKNIKNGIIKREPREYIAKDNYDSWMTRGTPEFGDILITTEAPLGNVAQIDITEKFALAQRAICLKFVINDISKYSYYFLRSYQFQTNLIENSTGTTVKGIKAANLKKMVIMFPPLAEQKQFAAKLDELLAQVDTLKTRLDTIPTILKRFRQSVLASAVSGKLTEEWRKNNLVSINEWKNLKISNIVKKIEAGKSLKCIEVPPKKNEFGIIKISAVTWGIYDELESKTLPDNALFIESRRVNVGDFLISRANTIELLGNPVIVHEVTKNLMLSDKVLRLVMSKKDKPWLNIFLKSNVGRREIEARSTGNQLSMRNIGQKALLDIDISKPCDEEQTEIVRQVEQLLTFADKIEQRVKKAQSKVNNLPQSILAKAFRGELTEEWRKQNPALISDEHSAEALLEKIKAERERLEPKKQTAKKKTRPKRKVKA